MHWISEMHCDEREMFRGRPQKTPHNKGVDYHLFRFVTLVCVIFHVPLFDMCIWGRERAFGKWTFPKRQFDFPLRNPQKPQPPIIGNSTKKMKAGCNIFFKNQEFVLQPSNFGPTPSVRRVCQRLLILVQPLKNKVRGLFSGNLG